MTATSRYRWLALALVAGMATYRYAALRKPPGIEAYHERVRAAAALVPRQIGGWVGQDAPVPPRAMAVLEPNVVLSRRYQNVENGSTAFLFLVHCADAHDMVGHYPLRCYPAQGWNLRSQRPCDWAAGDLGILGTEYEFAKTEPGVAREEQTIVVANCLMRPDGRTFREMGGMSDSIAGAGGQASGAGQIQVYFDGTVSPTHREEAINELLRGCKPVLAAILAEVAP
jgi:hypothetical protein